MRPLYKYLSLVSLVLVVVSGCFKTPLYTPSVVATIDSLPFSASGANQVIGTTTAITDFGTTLNIKGTTSVFTPGTATTPIIALNIPVKLGNYTINKSCSAIIYTAVSGTGGTKADSGIISVVKIDMDNNRIQGTFSFVCANGQKVTAGQFCSLLPK